MELRPALVALATKVGTRLVFEAGKDAAMDGRTWAVSTRWLLGLCLTANLASVGCLQTTIGGQTLPSAYYLDDDVQYFPAGPETKLANQIRALERYRVEQEGLQSMNSPQGAY